MIILKHRVIFLLTIVTFIFVSCSDKVDEGTLYSEAQDFIDQYQGDPAPFREAKKRLEKLKKINPNSPYTLVGTGRFIYKTNYINGDNYKKRALLTAKGYLDRAVEEYPEFIDGYYYGGYASLFLKDLPRGKLLAEELGKRNPGSVKSLLLTAEVLYREELYDSAIVLCRKALTLEPSKKEYRSVSNLLIESLIQKKEYRKADYVYRDMTYAQPNSAWTKGNYSGFLRRYMKNYDEAIVQAEAALELMDYGMGHYVLGKACYQKGYQLHWKQKNDREAIPYYEKAVKHLREPDSNLHYSLGMAYYKVGHGSKNREMILKAETHLKKAVQIDPNANDARTYLNRVRKLIDWLGDR